MRGIKNTLSRLLLAVITVGFALSSNVLYGKVGGTHASTKGARARALASAVDEDRIGHAKELLGKHYGRSVVKSGERVGEIRSFVQEWTKRSLSAKWKKKSKAIARAIIKESDRYGFDPVFLMAVIQNESSFNPEIRGSFGEIGLMQIKPSTAEWIAKKQGMKWKGDQSLFDPVSNIQYGSAYLAHLRERFDSHGRLYLSAYNMGTTNVNRALGRNVWPREYASRVMQRYISFYSELRDSVVADAGGE